MYDKIIKWSIYLLVFLLPVFFLPFSFEAFEFNKQYLLFFLVSLAFLAWLAKMVLVDKEIRFKRSPLDLFVLAFLFIAILSSVFPVDRLSSLLGFYRRLSGGLIELLSLGILYFLVTNNVVVRTPGSPESRTSDITMQGIIKIFIWSVLFVVLFSYLSIFGVWQKIPGLPTVMKQQTFNPASGSLEGLAVFLAIVLIFLISEIIISAQKARRARSFINYLLFAILILLVIIDFTPAWIILLITSVLFTGFALGTKISKKTKNLILLPIILMIIALLFILIDTSILNFQLPKEQILDQGTSWRVALGTSTDNVKNGFLGSGIGTFFYDFSSKKPVEFNQNPLWQIRFDRSGNHIAEILATMGFLGLISYLALIGFFWVISWFILVAKREGEVFYGLPLLLVLLALLIGQFVYYQNTVLAFTFWLFLGISMVSFLIPTREKTFSLEKSPLLGLISAICLIIIGLGILTGYYFAQKLYRADVVYTQALKTVLGPARTSLLEKAVRLNPSSSLYRIILARNYFEEGFQEIRKPLAEQDSILIKEKIAKAVGEAKTATQLSPNNVASWEILGMVYRDIYPIVTGVGEWAIKSFEKAITLEPTNPVLPTELGKLYLASDEIQKAKIEISKAKELKSDYLDALVQEALIYEKEDNLSLAIEKMRDLAENYPFNTEILFQLGHLYFNNNQTNEAIDQFEKALQIFPNHSNSLYALGLAYQKKGLTGKALEQFEKVLELNPGNQDVIQKIAELKKPPAEEKKK